jgi:protocatechuate 3,4-dioxygenase beta subunit
MDQRLTPLLLLVVTGACSAVLAEQVPTTQPSGLSSRALIAPANEPGPRMIISGTVYAPDGRSPVEGAILYVYHTDASGEYQQRRGQRADAPEYRLQAWMKTDANGRYEFETIKPGAYPGDSTEPSHIHCALTRPGGSPDWQGDYLFKGDPKIAARHLRNGVVLTLRERDDGVLVGTRDFVLERK